MELQPRRPEVTPKELENLLIGLLPEHLQERAKHEGVLLAEDAPNDVNISDAPLELQVGFLESLCVAFSIANDISPGQLTCMLFMMVTRNVSQQVGKPLDGTAEILGKIAEAFGGTVSEVVTGPAPDREH